MVESLSGVLRDFQRQWVHNDAEVRNFAREPSSGGIPLADVVRQVQPTMLIGTSTVPGSFTEAIVRQMAAHAERPVILPLSNPTELSEATPTDLLEWSAGKALVATGSPFGPVTYDGISYAIAQANNALIFPGLGLGTIVSRAARISDGMLSAAARAVAGIAGSAQAGGPILPAVEGLRTVSTIVACAVAQRAAAEGLTRAPLPDLSRQVAAAMWQPAYCPVEAA